jgi:hypothetical protein
MHTRGGGLFSATDSWVPLTRRPSPDKIVNRQQQGLRTVFRKYLDAIETFWIQYFVAFDNQEQRSLFTTMRRGLTDYQDSISFSWNTMQTQLIEWWNQVRGDQGVATSFAAIGRGALIFAAVIISVLLFVWLYRKIVKLKVWRVVRDRLFGRRGASVVEFYARMQAILAGKGLVRLPHQTPLEFAYAVGIPEAVRITQEYNRVRFGESGLSQDEAAQVEHWLKEISTTEKQRRSDK